MRTQGWAALAIGGAALAGCSSGGGKTTSALPPVAVTSAAPAPASAPTSAAAPTSAPTSSAASATSSAAPTSAAPTLTTPTTPTTPAGPQPGLVLTGQGSALTPPGSPTVKQTEGEPCTKLVDELYSAGACLTLDTSVGQAVALVETLNDDQRVLVYTLRGRQATLALREERRVMGTANGEPANVAIVTSDLAGDAQQKFVITTPQGDGGALELAQLDVVEASGTVVLHRELKGGQARKAPVGGGLETYTPADGGKVTDTIIRYSDGQWRLVSTSTISTSQVPSTGQY